MHSTKILTAAWEADVNGFSRHLRIALLADEVLQTSFKIGRDRLFELINRFADLRSLVRGHVAQGVHKRLDRAFASEIFDLKVL